GGGARLPPEAEQAGTRAGGDEARLPGARAPALARLGSPARDAALRRGAMRFGCLFVPDLPLQALLRVEPDLHGRPVAVAQGEGAREAALDAAAAVSPRVEEVAPGLVLVDARGLGKLHGGDRGLASALLAAARRVGLEGKAGVASGKRIARIAAVRGEGIEVV